MVVYRTERKHNNANLMYRFYIAQPNIDVFAFKPFSSTSASFSAFIFHITCCMQIHTIRSTGCPRSMVFYTPHRKSMADIILFASEMRDLYSNWSNINVQIWLYSNRHAKLFQWKNNKNKKFAPTMGGCVKRLN